MRVLDLFSGIGGFSLGLKRAGMQTVAFCEVDPWCRKVLAKHWPEVPIHDDIRTLFYTESQRRGARRTGRIVAQGENGQPAREIYRGTIDVVCGGFPCQDLSAAGKQVGIDGERSGLWAELARVLGEVRPRFAIVENVPMLLAGDRGRWFQRVLGDLAALGFDAEWHCIPASAVGAPHRRDRVWLVAYPHRQGESIAPLYTGEISGLLAADAYGGELREQPERQRWGGGQNVAGFNGANGDMADPDRKRLERPELLSQRLGIEPQSVDPGWWSVEPNVGRVAHGVSKRVDRLRGLGNAVVPQVVEVIGRAIMDTQEARDACEAHSQTTSGGDSAG